MNGMRILTGIPAALLLSAAVSWAQTADDGNEPASDTASTQQQAGKDDTAGRPAQADGSPSDYRASEEISEDLPVSWPVDI